MRLQKYLAECGVASRRAAEDMIRSGRVSVNGAIVTEMGVRVEDGDEIAVDGKAVSPEENRRVIILYKPVAVMTTLSDPEGRRTVRDLLTDVKERVVPVGRLDWDTEGLLLLTNDGALCHKLSHPSSQVVKTYMARVRPAPGEAALAALREGVLMDGETRPTAPAQVSADYQSGDVANITISIHEGRNRQVRRMISAVGLAVLSLRRTGYASLTLEGLRPGQWRDLTDAELARLQQLVEKD